MKEIITTILIVVVTNWNDIGELKTKDGKTFSVQEGRLQTNTVAHVEWREQVSAEEMAKLGTTALGLVGNYNTNEFVLKSVPGPVIGEKRFEMTNIYIKSITVTNPWWSPYIISNGVIMNRDGTW